MINQKMWIGKGSTSYNRSTKSRFQYNDMEIYSIHKEKYSPVSKRFFRTLNKKIYEYITSV